MTSGKSLVATMTLFRHIRQFAHNVATNLWIISSWLLGWFARAAEPASLAGGERVMVIAPHPDDEALGCGGTIMRHIEVGDLVMVVYVTDGRLSRAFGLDSSSMAAARLQESRTAAAILKVSDVRWLGLPEGNWNATDFNISLTALMREYSPSLIYGPCWLDYHPEHRKVAACLADTVPAGMTVRIYTLHIPLGVLANCCVDVSAQLPALSMTFDAYRTQKYSLMRGIRIRRYAAARHRIGSGVEEFLEISGDAYIRLHKNCPNSVKVRGLRYWSFTDPLSYIIGSKARRAIAHQLGASR